MQLFEGVCSAIVTPFSDDGLYVNFQSFKKLVDFQIENNVNAIVFMGTTGESSTLSHDEKMQIAKFAVECVKGRVPVIIGAGGNNTKEVIENCQKYEKLGVDGLLLVTPYYNKATQNGLYKHFKLIAESVKLPIILYNIPSRTGLNMLPETVLELSKIKNIIGIKEASGDINQVMTLRKILPKKFMIYSGDDALTLPMLMLGANGVISVISNILPKEMSLLCKYFKGGKIEKAQKLHYKLLPKIKSLFCEVNPIPIKYALNIKGFEVGIPRMPLTRLDEKFENLIKSQF